MKTAFIFLACGLISAGALVAQQVVEKETKTTTTTKTTTGTGTIAEYVPGSTFVLKETSGPVTYRYGNKVTYVTKSGTVIPEAELKTRLKVGNAVSVDYVSEGDSRVINKIVIDD